jgi:hypothetical protein
MTPVRFFQIAAATAGAGSQGEILEKVTMEGGMVKPISADGSDPKELEELVLHSMRKILREALGGPGKPA